MMATIVAARLVRRVVIGQRALSRCFDFRSYALICSTAGYMNCMGQMEDARVSLVAHEVLASTERLQLPYA
jgi:hypothetical protein